MVNISLAKGNEEESQDPSIPPLAIKLNSAYVCRKWKRIEVEPRRPVVAVIEEKTKERKRKREA